MQDFGKIKWSISRGKDTFGYNICSLTVNGKKYSCNGGGYDMLGTCFALYLVDRYRDRLVAYKAKEPKTYGLNPDGYLEGATGFENVRIIARDIGIKVAPVRVNFPRKGWETIGYNFEDLRAKENAEAAE